MSTTADEYDIGTSLRKKAEAHLQAGTTPTSGQWSLGVDTLRLLHRLSSSPDNAEDALKLLHELQVHQVELDLQGEEIAANERALLEELHLYRTLFESAPLGYCVLDFEGVVILGNPAAAELFGVDSHELAGRRIDTFLTPNTRPPLRDLLTRVARDGATGSCVAQMDKGAEGIRELRLVASLPTGGEQRLLVGCERIRAD